MIYYQELQDQHKSIGRDELTIKEKVKFDVKYCEKISFKNDIQIFLLTIPTVLKGIKNGKVK